MLNASFGCIAYLRGIFPDDSFLEERYNAGSQQKMSKDTQMSNSQDNGQRLMRLRRDTSPEAKQLLDYLVRDNPDWHNIH